jgi:hypothetical protein
MADPESAEVTVLLKAWSGGDQAALDRLMLVVYGDLRRMRRAHPTHTPAPLASAIILS